LTASSYGDHIVIAGGTGLFPFLDLMDFLLKKTIFLLFLEKFSDEILKRLDI